MMEIRHTKAIAFICYNRQGERKLCTTQKECADFLEMTPSHVSEHLRGERGARGIIVRFNRKNKLERAVLDYYATKADCLPIKDGRGFKNFFAGVDFVLSLLSMQSSTYAKEVFINAVIGEYDRKFNKTKKK